MALTAITRGVTIETSRGSTYRAPQAVITVANTVAGLNKREAAKLGKILVNFATAEEED